MSARNAPHRTSLPLRALCAQLAATLSSGESPAEVAVQQLESADVVVINKRDLMDDEDVERVRDYVLGVATGLSTAAAS